MELDGPTPHGIAPLCPLGGLQMPFHLRIIAICFPFHHMYQNLKQEIIRRSNFITTAANLIKGVIQDFCFKIGLFIPNVFSMKLF